MEIEDKKTFIDGLHFMEDHHATSLPSVVQQVPKLRVPFARKKLDLGIYTFQDCEDKLEDRGAVTASIHEGLVLVSNLRTSSFEKGWNNYDDSI